MEIPPQILPPADEFEILILEEAEESGSGGDITRLMISFPDIEETLPAVWGVNEPLTVSFRLGDEEGNTVLSRDCDIDWGDGETIQEKSDETGRFGLSHTFKTTGEYVINASYTEDVSVGTISSWRKIRIVDYREEMVRLFNEMLKTMDIKDIRVDPEMTPREIEEIFKPRLVGIGEITIKRLITGFEEANYSTHPVTRDSYLGMHGSVREILSYGK